MKQNRLSKKITRRLFSVFLLGIIAFTSIGIANAKTGNGDPIKNIRDLYSPKTTEFTFKGFMTSSPPSGFTPKDQDINGSEKPVFRYFEEGYMAYGEDPTGESGDKGTRDLWKSQRSIYTEEMEPTTEDKKNGLRKFRFVFNPDVIKDRGNFQSNNLYTIYISKGLKLVGNLEIETADRTEASYDKSNLTPDYVREINGKYHAYIRKDNTNKTTWDVNNRPTEQKILLTTSSRNEKVILKDIVKASDFPGIANTDQSNSKRNFNSIQDYIKNDKVAEMGQIGNIKWETTKHPYNDINSIINNIESAILIFGQKGNASTTQNPVQVIFTVKKDENSDFSEKMFVGGNYKSYDGSQLYVRSSILASDLDEKKTLKNVVHFEGNGDILFDAVNFYKSNGEKANGRDALDWGDSQIGEAENPSSGESRNYLYYSDTKITDPFTIEFEYAGQKYKMNNGDKVQIQKGNSTYDVTLKTDDAIKDGVYNYTLNYQKQAPDLGLEMVVPPVDTYAEGDDFDPITAKSGEGESKLKGKDLFGGREFTPGDRIWNFLKDGDKKAIIQYPKKDENGKEILPEDNGNYEGGGLVKTKDQPDGRALKASDKHVIYSIPYRGKIYHYVLPITVTEALNPPTLTIPLVGEKTILSTVPEGAKEGDIIDIYRGNKKIASYTLTNDDLSKEELKIPLNERIDLKENEKLKAKTVRGKNSSEDSAEVTTLALELPKKRLVRKNNSNNRGTKNKIIEDLQTLNRSKYFIRSNGDDITISSKNPRFTRPLYINLEDFMTYYYPPQVTRVKDSNKLTEEEKAKVREAIKTANSKLNLTDSDIEVSSSGETKIKIKDEYASLNSKETVMEVRSPIKTPIKNPEQLTEVEKEKIKQAVKNANPNFSGRDITIDVSDDGTVTITEKKQVRNEEENYEYTISVVLEPEEVIEVAPAVCTQEPAVGSPENTLVGISTINRENGNWDLNGLGAYIALESNTKGFIITRNANPKNNIANPVEGMIVWDTTDNCLKLFSDKSGSLEWNCIKQGCNKKGTGN